MSRAGEIRSMMQLVELMDRTWQKKVPEDDTRCIPWMPFPVPEYIALLTQAITAASGDRFLEVGSGIGTKMLITHELFGLDVFGIDRVPEFTAQALELNGTGSAETADALGWGGYGNYNIIFFNRVFRDRGMQRELEAQVWKDTAPGAVVILVNYEGKPPSSWFIVEQDDEVRRGAWMKPPG